jgi:hypothetical protein
MFTYTGFMDIIIGFHKEVALIQNIVYCVWTAELNEPSLVTAQLVQRKQISTEEMRKYLQSTESERHMAQWLCGR